MSDPTRAQVVGTGVAFGAVGGLLTLTLIGAVVGIPMILIGLIFIFVGLTGWGVTLADEEDESPDAVA